MRSIDAWQGREKEIIVFSCVRSNSKGKIGFLDNGRRINVALTRAKHGLIIIGNVNTLSTDPNWRALIEFMRDRDTVVEGFEGAR